MQTRITHLTDGEIEARNKARMQQLADDANYATILGLFFGGVAEKPEPREYGLTEEDHNRIMRLIAA